MQDSHLNKFDLSGKDSYLRDRIILKISD